MCVWSSRGLTKPCSEGLSRELLGEGSSQRGCSQPPKLVTILCIQMPGPHHSPSHPRCKAQSSDPSSPAKRAGTRASAHGPPAASIIRWAAALK